MMSSPSILVVDDSATARRAMVQSLQKIGYSEILQACSGEEALEILFRSSVDLVILDIEMPGMNGMAVLWVMKRDPQFKEIPVIVRIKEGFNRLSGTHRHQGIDIGWGSTESGSAQQMGSQIAVPYFLRQGGEHMHYDNTIEAKELQGDFREILPLMI